MQFRHTVKWLNNLNVMDIGFVSTDCYMQLFPLLMLDSNCFAAAAECKRLHALGPGARRSHLIAALICAIQRESRPMLRDRNNEGERAPTRSLAQMVGHG
jgi:hypothetical protein